jgi:hypothetical protein
MQKNNNLYLGAGDRHHSNFRLFSAGDRNHVCTRAPRAQQAFAPVSDMTSNPTASAHLSTGATVLPDPVTIINQVRSLARLETIQYTIEKVITAETGQGALALLFGYKLILVAHGSVIGGVDLSQLGPENLWLEDGVLNVYLPDPEIFVATLDNEKSYIYDRETGLLTHGDINLESEARRVAEDEIKKAAVLDGILSQARTNAENYLYRLFRSLGFPEVNFIPPDDD